MAVKMPSENTIINQLPTCCRSPREENVEKPDILSCEKPDILRALDTLHAKQAWCRKRTKVLGKFAKRAPLGRDL